MGWNCHGVSVCLPVVTASEEVVVARAYSCVCAVGRLVGDCHASVAASLLRVEVEPATLLTALTALATAVTESAHELAAQV